MTLKFKATDYDVALAETINLVADSINYIKVQFEFMGDMWKPDYSYCAIFYNSNNEAIKIPLIDNSCTLPRLSHYCFRVGVMATFKNSEGNIAEVYSKTATVILSESCYNGDYQNAATPSEYAELRLELEALKGSSGGTAITVDSELTSTGENPVQGKVIKEYVDDSVAVKGDKTKVATTIPLNNTLLAGTEYYIGEQTSLSLAFESLTEEDRGSYIYISFKSGGTATNLTLDTSNTTDLEFAPSANSVCEIMGKWNGSMWMLLSCEMAVTASE